MRLCFDVESSGLLKPGVPPDDPSQPNMVQLGAIVFDGKWSPVAKFVSLIKPDGWAIEPEAEAHHRISEARCAKYGVPAHVALAALQSFSTNVLQIICHNVTFDRAIIAAELRRCGSDGLWWRKQAPKFACTMEASTTACGIPGKFGLKFPSLEEAHRRFIPATPWQSKHEAEDDLNATARIAQALEREGLLPAPSLRPPVINTEWRQST